MSYGHPNKAQVLLLLLNSCFSVYRFYGNIDFAKMQMRHVRGAKKLKSTNFSWFLILSDNLFIAIL